MAAHARLKGTELIRTQVNSYPSQFVLILVSSYSFFGQFILISFSFGQFVLIWLIRTHFGQFVLILKFNIFKYINDLNAFIVAFRVLINETVSDIIYIYNHLHLS